MGPVTHRAVRLLGVYQDQAHSSSPTQRNATHYTQRNILSLSSAAAAAAAASPHDERAPLLVAVVVGYYGVLKQHR
jgi:hypothetical protein